MLNTLHTAKKLSSFNTMYKILVTGAAGYIGLHACKILTTHGYHVVGIDNLSRSTMSAEPYCDFRQGDINDIEFLNLLFSTQMFDAVMHFAGYAYVGESVQNPGMYYKNNFIGTMNIIDAALKYGVSNFIFSSSCSVYGDACQRTLVETSAKHPLNPYAESKLFSERLINSYAKSHGLRAVILRYFNVAGADPEGDIGWVHIPETRLIPLALLAAMNPHGSPLIVNGNNFDTPDGTCIRDYIHVCDLVQAHMSALNYIFRGGNSIALNVGTGQGCSVLDIIRSIKSVTGLDVPYVVGPHREGDPPMLVADIGLANQTINFVPIYSDINNIITDAYAWLRKRT